MRRAGIVALNTFREAVRDRVLYNLVFFALLMMAAAVVVGQISIGIEESVIVSLGLSAISVIGLLISVFIGVGLVSKEMEKRTLYALLAKPVRRWRFCFPVIRRRCLRFCSRPGCTSWDCTSRSCGTCRRK